MAMRNYSSNAIAAELLKYGFKKYKTSSKFQVWKHEETGKYVFIPKADKIPGYYLDRALEEIGKLYHNKP